MWRSMYIYDCMLLSFLRMRMFETKVVEKIKTHILCSVVCFAPQKIMQFMTGIILRMRNISDKSCRENQNTHFEFSSLFSHEKLCSLWQELFWEWEIFQTKSWRENQNTRFVFNSLYFPQKSCSLWQELFLEWEMFQTRVVDKIKTHILCSVPFNRKWCCLWDDVAKYGRARQVAVDVMILYG